MICVTCRAICYFGGDKSHFGGVDIAKVGFPFGDITDTPSSGCIAEGGSSRGIAWRAYAVASDHITACPRLVIGTIGTGRDRHRRAIGTIAILILAIFGEIRLRCDGTITSGGKRAIDTLSNTGTAGTGAGVLSVLECTARRSCGIAGPFHWGCGTGGVIDGPIAVIVFSVAKVGAGCTGSGIADGLFVIGGIAYECSRGFTLAFPFFACLAQVGKVFIDQAVTVVIFAVAHFGGGGDSASTSPPATLCITCLGALRALAFVSATLLRIASGTLAKRLFIDVAITVFVEGRRVSTGFCLWCLFAYTSTPFAVLAGLFAAFANAFPFCARWSSVAILRSAIGARTFLSIGEVVDLTIAIVIFLVACFGFWLDSCRTCGFSVGTSIDANFALPFASSVSARVAFAWERFIDIAVAVVVFAIAHFGCGIDFANALA
jgi:hypothetical protein